MSLFGTEAWDVFHIFMQVCLQILSNGVPVLQKFTPGSVG